MRMCFWLYKARGSLYIKRFIESTWLLFRFILVYKSSAFAKYLLYFSDNFLALDRRFNSTRCPIEFDFVVELLNFSDHSKFYFIKENKLLLRTRSHLGLSSSGKTYFKLSVFLARIMSLTVYFFYNSDYS